VDPFYNLVNPAPLLAVHFQMGDERGKTMKIGDVIRAQGSSLSFEFFPPKDEVSEARLFQTIAKLESFGPTFVSVTYGAGGGTLPASLVERMQKAKSADEARRFGIDFATRQCENLWSNGVRYFHFYILNRSEAVTEILCNFSLMEKLPLRECSLSRNRVSGKPPF